VSEKKAQKIQKKTVRTKQARQERMKIDASFFLGSPHFWFKIAVFRKDFLLDFWQEPRGGAGAIEV
jgi:hypothetical protein